MSQRFELNCGECGREMVVVDCVWRCPACDERAKWMRAGRIAALKAEIDILSAKVVRLEAGAEDDE